jgi:carboxypeptidase C (cathepsin A)
MSLNEHMKVFISHGYFDLITPYFSSQRLIQVMKLTRSQRDNLTTKNYLGGHMYYSWDESRVAFRNDAQAFYESAIG